MPTPNEFNWEAVDARIRKLEGVADAARAFTRARTFPEVARASARLHAALDALDRTGALPPREVGAPLPKEHPPEQVVVADLLRRKRLYETLLRTGQQVAEMGDGAS